MTCEQAKSWGYNLALNKIQKEITEKFDKTMKENKKLHHYEANYWRNIGRLDALSEIMDILCDCINNE